MKNRIKQIWDKLTAFWIYCSHGVWSDTRSSIRVNLIKTLNITVTSFFNTDIQSQACAMTYRTILAVVPALALVFAIGRGFGFQNLLQDELYKLLPSQKTAITHALKFVDSYINQASEGIFVGVGIVFLLWTLISLISSVESSFDLIWGVKRGRNMWRKISDYTAMFLILPILMVCGSGLSIFLNQTVMNFFDFPFISPMMSVFMEIGSYVFTCLFFCAMFIMIPNARVRFSNALIAGTFTGTAFLVLQWLFVSGQLYVSRYNAIYGSFSFLPLLLIWLQLVWVIIMSGCLICYASQNIFQYSFNEQIATMSRSYYEKVSAAVAAVVVQSFMKHNRPVKPEQLIKDYGIPSRLVNDITEKLTDIGIFSKVLIDDAHGSIGFQPAFDPSKLTLAYLYEKLDKYGAHDFIPGFNAHFPKVKKAIDKLHAAEQAATSGILISELDVSVKEEETPTQSIAT